MERDHSVPATVEVYVRSLSPEGTPEQQALFDQLDTISGQGVIDYWTVHVVGKEVCPDTATGTQPGQFICERIQQFKEWAEQNDMSFGSFFEQKQVTSEITDEAYETMDIPTVTLAEFDDRGTLQFVTPCSDGETHHTPASRLDELMDRGGDDTELAVSSQ